MTALDAETALEPNAGSAPPGPTAGQVVRRAVGADVARLLANDPIARVGEDPEGVHQARVAARRLRSQLATFKPVLRSERCNRLRTDLRWLGRKLGAVRDADVLRERMTKSVRGFDPRERDDALALLARIDADRGAKRDALAKVLESARYRKLVRELAGFVVDPSFRRSAGLPAAPFLSDVVYERFAELDAAVRALPMLPSDPELHAVRITAKPLRYAAEVASDVLGEGCERLARRATELCDELGTLNDGAKAIEWLEGAGSTPRSVAVARLRSGEVSRMAEARSSWRKDWARVRDAAGAMSWPLDGATA